MTRQTERLRDKDKKHTTKGRVGVNRQAAGESQMACIPVGEEENGNVELFADVLEELHDLTVRHGKYTLTTCGLGCKHKHTHTQ